MNRKWLALCLALLYSAAHAEDTVMTTQEAFSSGTTFGQERASATQNDISDNNAQEHVPNFSSTHEASNYYQDGKGNLKDPASSNVAACTDSQFDDSSEHEHGKCESVRMIMQDPGKKDVMYPLDPKTDPLFVKKNEVSDNPQSHIGNISFSGDYQGCTEKTISEPDTYVEEVCNQYIKTEIKGCSEVLTVVCQTKQENCEAGGVVPGSAMVDNGSYSFEFDGHELLLINNVTAQNKATYATFYFDIADIDKLTEFRVYKMHSDNWLGMAVNGRYLGTHTRYFDGFNTHSDRLTIERREVCYGINFCSMRDQVRYSETGYYNTETGRNYASNVEVDLMPYLTTGTNEIKMSVVNGSGPGYGKIYIYAAQKCEPECTESWDDQCTSLRNRSE